MPSGAMSGLARLPHYQPHRGPPQKKGSRRVRQISEAANVARLSGHGDGAYARQLR
jgi:hypothetical protein